MTNLPRTIEQIDADYKGGLPRNPAFDAIHRKAQRGEPLDSLDAIADVVLAYRPKPKSKPAKKRTRRANKIAKDIHRV